MPDEVKTLTAELARDPQSLVFLRLGDLLRKKGQIEAAQRVALHGLQRHPHLADAHDLYARVLADQHDYERAFDEWDMTLRIAPTHTGALKGLAFLYFKIGDVTQAEAHLEAAHKAAPEDASIEQALAVVRGRGAELEAAPTAAAAASAPSPAPRVQGTSPAAAAAAAPSAFDEARVFAGLEGAQEGLLLLDTAGRVLGGALRDPQGADVAATVAAYLAGVSQEAARTAKLLGLGAWHGLSAEGRMGHVHLTAPSAETLLLVTRERSMPLGRLAVFAHRATQAARRWLEQ